MAGEPDSTAVRTALWRGPHTLVDDPPHVLDDLIGLQIAGVDETWRTRADMEPARTRANRASIVARARAAEDTLIASGARQFEAGESWLGEAVEAGLEPRQPTVVSMLGVAM